ncbi:MAG: HEPN domain-containing protein, partial [Chloroflexi bacterium]|nr:HEPN domain-containing protein [Chloroflexota bacterium]
MKNSEADGKRWLSQAENDLSAARLMEERAFYAQACFICHQVAEKALKALAYYRGDRYVTGHSLLDLLQKISG